MSIVECGTRISILLDRTGSWTLCGVEGIINGLNVFLEEIKRYKYAASSLTIELNIFDSLGFDTLRRGPIDKISPLKSDEFKPRGASILYDSLYKVLSKENTTYTEFLVIIVDGSDVASKIELDEVISLIHEKGKDWIIFYLATNINAIKEAREMSINSDYAINFTLNSEANYPNQNPWKDFAEGIKQTPANYVFARTANIIVNHFSGKSVDIFSDLDRDFSMGISMGPIGLPTDWYTQVRIMSAAFTEPIETGKFDDCGLGIKAQFYINKLSDNFDPLKGSMIGGKYTDDDHCYEILDTPEWVYFEDVADDQDVDYFLKKYSPK